MPPPYTGADAAAPMPIGPPRICTCPRRCCMPLEHRQRVQRYLKSSVISYLPYSPYCANACRSAVANGWCPPLQTMTEPWLLVTARANGSPPIEAMRPWEQTYLTPMDHYQSRPSSNTPGRTTLEQVSPTNNRAPSETTTQKKCPIHWSSKQ